MIIQKIKWYEQLRDLLPQGICWDYEQGSNIDGLILSIQSLLESTQFNLVELFNGLMPDSTEGVFLDKWEKTVGLPNECSRFATFSDEQRRDNILGQLSATGGQSIAYYLSVMENMGYHDNTITEYSALKIGDPCDSYVVGEDWEHAWQININNRKIEYFTCQSECDDALSSGSDLWLECLMLGIKPAHTVLLFNYDNEEIDSYGTFSTDFNDDFK